MITRSRRPATLGALLVFLLAPIGCGDDEASGPGGGGAGGGVGASGGAGGGGAGGGGAGGDGGGPAPGCVEPTGAGTEHAGEISADETWTAEGNPHIVTTDFYVRDGTLTLEPCVVVRVQEGRTFTLNGQSGTATLRAHGEVIANGDGSTTTRPVTFLPDGPGTFWGSLLVRSTGLLDLEHVDLSGGGAHATAANLGGTIVASGDGGTSFTPNVRAVSVRIEDSEGFGVNLQGAGFTDDSTDLTITGSGQNPSLTNYVTDYPVLVSPPAIHTLPSGTYTGNAIDAVYVFAAGDVVEDETFKNLGVPYHLGGVFSMSPGQTVADGGLLILTVEAGVTIQMEPDNSFNLGTSNGSLPENIWPVQLVAEGTAADPIVFTSTEASPAAGDWGAIEWHGGPATGNVMSHVLIEYAGGDSGTSGFGCGPADNDAALLITNWRPDDDFIDNLTIAHSAAGGVVCGWTSDASGPDLKAGNTFTDIANGCEVSRWANVTPPPCPGNDAIPDCL